MQPINEKALKYRKLFAVHPVSTVPTTEPDVFVGISKSGELLCIYEGIYTVSAAWDSQRDVYLINKQEYRKMLEEAKNNGCLQKAIDKGRITLEEAEQLGI